MTDQIDETKKAEYFVFLEKLRKSGKTNMFGASPYVAKAFGVDQKYARKIVASWMESYGL